MRFGDLETPQLKEAAYREGESFSIDPDLLEDRQVREGFTIDASYSRDRDDAISLTRENDHATLHVSVADVGTFIRRDTAMQSYALRVLYSRYRGTMVQRPMLPPRISEGVLSLTEGQERPVITFHLPVDTIGRLGQLAITRDILVAQALTPLQVEEKLGAEKGVGYFSDLYTIARTLFKARHTDPDEPPVPEDEEGSPIVNQGREGAIGALILQECMIALNTALPGYMRQHDIPTLHRVHTPSFEDQERLSDYPELLKYVARARYSTVPHEHLGLNIPSGKGYGHFSSPLRRYPDFVGHGNLAAHLDGQEYPYDTEHLRHIVRRMEHLEKKKSVIDTAPALGRLHVRFGAKLAQTCQTEIENDEAHEGNLAYALFGNVHGTEEEIQLLRHTAADIIAQNIQKARAVLNVAVAKKLIMLEGSTGDTPGQSGIVAIDAKGNRYPYPLRGRPIQDTITTAKLLGRMVGHEITPVIPEKMTREGAILQAPFNYLKRLDINKNKQLRFGHTAKTDEHTGEVNITARLVIYGQHYARSITASTKNEAERKLGADIIQEFNLLYGVPELTIPNLDPSSGSNETAVSVLAMYAQKQKVERPDYQIVAVPDARTTVECHLTFIDVKGKPRVVIGHGTSHKKAKESAAVIALLQLAPPPTKRQNKK